MTTHKDRPHRKSCQYAQDECMACTCGGTREYQFGASVADAIAIQGIATLFARLQPAAVPDAYQKALDAALSFIGDVAPGASWWDDVWPEHDAALLAAQQQNDK